MGAVTRRVDTTDEWILVLEYQAAAGGRRIECRSVHALIEALPLWAPSALYSPDRYALQLHVPAHRPCDALRCALQLHDQARANLDMPALHLVRSEIMTTVEFQRQWADAGAGVPASRGVLCDDVYWATRAVLRAATADELTEIVARFVHTAGGWTQWGSVVPPEHVAFDVTLSPRHRRHAVVDGVSVARLILECALPALVADARQVLARLDRRPVTDAR